MSLAFALALAASIGVNAWLTVFVLVLLSELAPRRSGGGSPPPRGRFALTPASPILTSRKIARFAPPPPPSRDD